MQAFARTLSYEIRLCNNGELPIHLLAEVSASTLALAGEISPAWAREGARAIADHVPTAQARVLAGQGHIVADDVLISVLKEFLLSKSSRVRRRGDEGGAWCGEENQRRRT
jgi:hypothetical protein